MVMSGRLSVDIDAVTDGAMAITGGAERYSLLRLSPASAKVASRELSASSTSANDGSGIRMASKLRRMPRVAAAWAEVGDVC